jgi:plastocyanin
MDTPLTLTAGKPRRSVSTLSKLSATTLVGLAAIFSWMQAAVLHEAIPPLVVASVLFIGVAGAVVAGLRWAPALGAALSLLIGIGVFAPAAEAIAYELVNPRMPLGPTLLIILAMVVVGAVVGIWATLQNYRRPAEQRRAPRWLFIALAALVGVVAGFSALHSIAAPASSGVNPEALAGLPAVATRDMAFAQSEIRVRAGELVALRLENADEVPHSFDIDEFGIHTPMLAGAEPGLAFFKPEQPGTYTFYCAPHYNKATGEGMKGTLIVE